jgi:hypothetical protein
VVVGGDDQAAVGALRRDETDSLGLALYAGHPCQRGGVGVDGDLDEVLVAIAGDGVQYGFSAGLSGFGIGG